LRGIKLAAREIGPRNSDASETSSIELDTCAYKDGDSIGRGSDCLVVRLRLFNKSFEMLLEFAAQSDTLCQKLYDRWLGDKAPLGKWVIINGYCGVAGIGRTLRIEFIGVAGSIPDCTRQEVLQHGAVDKSVLVADSSQQAGVPEENFLRVQAKEPGLPRLLVPPVGIVNNRPPLLLLEYRSGKLLLIEDPVELESI